MYQRGERVVVASRGRETVLVVWEDRGRGLVLTSPVGYEQALAGKVDAPLVGYPRLDVVGRVEDHQPVTRP